MLPNLQNNSAHKINNNSNSTFKTHDVCVYTLINTSNHFLSDVGICQPTSLEINYSQDIHMHNNLNSLAPSKFTLNHNNSLNHLANNVNNNLDRIPVDNHDDFCHNYPGCCTNDNASNHNIINHTLSYNNSHGYADRTSKENSGLGWVVRGINQKGGLTFIVMASVGIGASVIFINQLDQLVMVFLKTVSLMSPLLAWYWISSKSESRSVMDSMLATLLKMAVGWHCWPKSLQSWAESAFVRQ
jgi:hypothetical protein